LYTIVFNNMIYIESLEIDDHILEKIENKHNVRFKEVEEVCSLDNNHVRKGREGLYKIFGKTKGGRYILVVLANKGSGNWKVATARDMTEVERQLYQREIGGK
jgi:uncharacterized DUF497 family protein